MIRSNKYFDTITCFRYRVRVGICLFLLFWKDSDGAMESWHINYKLSFSVILLQKKQNGEWSKLPQITQDQYDFLKFMSQKEKCHRSFAKRAIDLLYDSRKDELKTKSVFGRSQSQRLLKNGELKINPAKTPLTPQKVEAIKLFIKSRCRKNAENYSDRAANQYLAGALQTIQRRLYM